MNSQRSEPSELICDGPPAPDRPVLPKPDLFVTTRWTLVVAAAAYGVEGGSAGASERALQELCRAYWPPLYAFARRHGRKAEDAEDLTQGFFARMLAGRGFASAAGEKGRFRAFLLASMKHFMANDWAKAGAVKRGGGLPALSLNLPGAEALFASVQATDLAPDRAYDRAWALTVLERVLDRLRDEHSSPPQAVAFQLLKEFLTAERSDLSCIEAAEKLDSTPGAVRVAIHRLRQRYRELLRQEIAGTLLDPGQTADELQSLFQAFLE